MKSVFLIERSNFYRGFAPLIKEALNRGQQVEIWHNYDPAILNSHKPYLFPHLDQAPASLKTQNIKFRTYTGMKSLLELLKGDSKIRWVFSQDNSRYLYAAENPETFEFLPVNVMIPDTYFDLGTLCDQMSHSLERAQKKKQVYFIFSEFWRQEASQYFDLFHPKASSLWSGKSIDFWSVGSVENDVFQEIDPEEVRFNYGIPRGKKLFLYLGFPFYSFTNKSAWDKVFCGLDMDLKKIKNGFYSHKEKESVFNRYLRKTKYLLQIARDPYALGALLRQENEYAVMQKIKEMCQKAGLFLVVKSRLKFPVTESVQKCADLCVWDDELQQDQPIVKQLLSISKVNCSYMSMAVLHAASAGVFSLHFKIPEYHFGNDRLFHPYRDYRESLFDFPGVASAMTVSDFLKEENPIDYEALGSRKDSFEKYCRKFLTFHEFGASKRIFDLLLEKY